MVDFTDPNHCAHSDYAEEQLTVQQWLKTRPPHISLVVSVEWSFWAENLGNVRIDFGLGRIVIGTRWNFAWTRIFRKPLPCLSAQPARTTAAP
jgi:hypothetical protein